ncbi:MAG: ABC transporter permease [Anaerolineales bacterium]
MKGYFRYFSGKALWFLITLLFAFILNFLLPRMMPGDPIKGILSRVAQGMSDATGVQATYQRYTELFGLDKPLPQQFLIYVNNVLHGDFGYSIAQYPRTVADVIASSLWWTVILQLPAILVGWLIGNFLGVLAAYRKSGFDKVLMPASIFASSLPAFGMAVILMVVFAFTLEWLPSSGGYGFDMIPNLSWGFIWSVLVHYQLPFWSIVLVLIGGQAIGMRAMSIYELNSDYVKFARFMGIKDRKILRYVFRNAMLPQVTGLALAIGTLVGGALVAEIVFSYPGLGTTIFSAALGGDYPLISATALIITMMVLITTFTIEILYGFIDPRIRAAQIED